MANEELAKYSNHSEEEYNQLELQLEKVECRLNRLYNVLETADINISDLAPRLKELSSQQQELIGKRNELAKIVNDERPRPIDLDTVKEYVLNLKGLLESASLLERKMLLRSFVKNVAVDFPKITIDYYIPLPGQDLLNNSREVLSIKKQSSPTRIRTSNLAVNSRPLYH